MLSASFPELQKYTSNVNFVPRRARASRSEKPAGWAGPAISLDRLLSCWFKRVVLVLEAIYNSNSTLSREREREREKKETHTSSA